MAKTNLQTLKGFRDFLPKLALTRQKNMKKTFLYIDGTNLLAGLIDIFGYNKVPSFSSIVKLISKYHKIDQIFFYASYTSSKNVTNLKIKKQIGLEIDFFKEVRKQKKLTFYQGYRSPTSKKEKGVDVHLAVDMVKHAFLKKFNEAIIFSGDADFEYSVEILRNIGLPVYAFFLPNRFSLAIAYKSISPKVLDYNESFKNIKLRKKIDKLKIIKIKKI